jgi:hypothetical protein
VSCGFHFFPKLEQLPDRRKTRGFGVHKGSYTTISWKVRLPGTKDVFHQIIDIVGTAISEFALGQRPDAFIGIEFRGIGGKVLDGETRVLTKEFLEWFPLMGAGVRHPPRSGWLGEWGRLKGGCPVG